MSEKKGGTTEKRGAASGGGGGGGGGGGEFNTHTHSTTLLVNTREPMSARTSAFKTTSSDEEVVPFILCNTGVFTPVEETLAWLRTINKRLSVVCCVGKYRTGKSFLLNTLARTGASTGFLVGKSVQACTKGLWLMRSPLFEDDRTCVLLMDSEGIDSLEAGDNHDVMVFTLALLLSSIFCYNSTGALDEAAMQTLSLVTNVCERVRVGARGGPDASDESDTCDGRPEALADDMPQFIWILRDFALQLQTRSGAACDPDSYLEEALTDASSCGEGRSRVRQVIRAAFPNRALVTLPHPTINTQQNLTSGVHNNTFRAAVDTLRERLVDTSRCLKVRDQPMTGGMYATAALELCAAINTSGTVPTLRDSWTLLADCQAKDLMMSTIERAGIAMRRAVGDTMTTMRVSCVLDECVEEHFRQFCDEPLLTARTEEVDVSARSKLQALRDDCVASHAARRKGVLSGLVKAIVSEREESWMSALRAMASSVLTADNDDTPGHAADLVRFDEAKHVSGLLCTRFLDEWGPGLILSRDAAQQQARDADRRAETEVERERVCLSEATAAHQRENDELRRALQGEIDHLNALIAVNAEELAEARDCARRCIEKTETRDARGVDIELDGVGGGSEALAVERVYSGLNEAPPIDADLEERLGRVLEIEEHSRALEIKLEEAESARRIASERCAHALSMRDKLQSALASAREEWDGRVNRAESEADTARRQTEKLHVDALEAHALAEEAQRCHAAIETQATADGEASRRLVRECRENALAARAGAEDSQARLMHALDAHLKDTRHREIEHRRDIVQINARVADAESSKLDLLRRVDRLVGDNEVAKRKACESAHLEQELKRSRSHARSFEIQVARLSTELDQSRKRCTALVEEREKCNKDWVTLLTNRDQSASSAF